MGKEDLDMIPESESDTIEFKSSIFHSANPKDQSSNHQVIISAMVGLANKRGGKVFVGLNNHGEIVGIENELQASKFNTVGDFLNDLKNRIFQLTNSHRFMSSVSLELFKTDQGKVFLQISVPKSPEIILLRGSILLVRDSAGTRQLKNHDLINFIKQY
jgi:predicted HTH transcriptional regulator